MNMNGQTNDILMAALVTMFSLGGGVFLVLSPWLERRLPKPPVPLYGPDAVIFGSRFSIFLGVLSILFGLLMGATLIVMLR